MLSKLTSNNNYDLKSLFESLQFIYSGCFQELIRQISIECKSKGNLIKKIWTSYLQIFEKTITERDHIILNQESTYLNEIGRIHKLYQKELEIFYKKNETLTHDKKKLISDLDKSQTNFKYLLGKNEKVPTYLIKKPLIKINMINYNYFIKKN